ncbi:unnamed protein product, partial [Clonostachys solani]
MPHASKVDKTSQDTSIWRGICRRQVVGTISASELDLPLSADKVTSSQGCDLICNYNLRIGGEFWFPGCLPEWKEIPLPITLKRSERTTDREWPRYSFEPMFQAVEEMNAQLKFNDVDIICNRNCLRSLLRFCCMDSSQSFQVNLQLVYNTLLIESYNPHPFVDKGFGRVFENVCRSYPTRRVESSSHYCALRYPLGELSCVVRCEVDASYNDPEKPSWTSNIRTKNKNEAMRRAGLNHQSTAAELKSTASSISQSKCMPQLWFGRTSWLIRGTHSNGTFHDVSITNAGASFNEWEEENQTELQRLVMVLKQLRAITRDSGGGQCAAIFEQRSKSREIKVFRRAEKWQAIPEPFILKFWDS